MRILLLTMAAITLTAACATSQQRAPVGSSLGTVSPTPAEMATPVPTEQATPTETPTPAPPAVPAPPAAPPPQAPPPATRTFPLGGNGSVTVTVTGSTGRITVSIGGLAAVGHAVHLHAGCDGSASAHIATIGIVGSSGTVGISVPVRTLGATVIVYPDTSATGRPILCGATA